MIPTAHEMRQVLMDSAPFKAMAATFNSMALAAAHRGEHYFTIHKLHNPEFGKFREIFEDLNYKITDVHDNNRRNPSPIGWFVRF